MAFAIGFEPPIVSGNGAPEKTTLRGFAAQRVALNFGSETEESPGEAKLQTEALLSGEPVAGETVDIEALLFEILVEYDQNANVALPGWETRYNKGKEAIEKQLTALEKKRTALTAKIASLEERVLKLNTKYNEVLAVWEQQDNWQKELEEAYNHEGSTHSRFAEIWQASATRLNTLAERTGILAEREAVKAEIHATEAEKEESEKETNALKNDLALLEYENRNVAKQGLNELLNVDYLQAVLTLDQINGMEVGIINLTPQTRIVSSSGAEEKHGTYTSKINKYQAVYAGRLEMVNAPELLRSQRPRLTLKVTGPPKIEVVRKGEVNSASITKVTFAPVTFQLQCSTAESLARP